MKVAVIGTGNVGTQFSRIFGVKPISSRTLEGLPSEADLYIIAVSDAVVKEVAEKLPETNGIVVHTTGSVPIDALKSVRCKGYGVMYPFQTISKKRPLPPEKIPLLLEASDIGTLSLIKSVANEAGFSNIEIADSNKRHRVHLTGTFACNFTNAMIAAAQKILNESGISSSIIQPLVEETVEKLKSLPAKDAQTGPAARKDFSTINSHLDLLNELKMTKEADIYKVVSDYIMNK
ncbi:MAG: DUF2520 domain-containing protein [Muribaculaceae bacterium]|nr:DUF2520 domain-containing protein [Muribaculaceae bacterium]